MRRVEARSNARPLALLAPILLTVALGPPPAAAQDPTAEIRRVVLTSVDSTVDLRIDADRPIEWKTIRGRDGNLVVELPRSRPAPGVTDIVAGAGLIRSVTVRGAVSSGERPPLTRVTITPREPTAHSVLPSASGLVVRFRPARTVAMPRDRFRVTAAPCLNLRAAPAITAVVITCLPNGSVLVAVDTREGWSQLRLADGQRGWVSTDYLEPVAAPETSRDPEPQAVETRPEPRPSEPTPPTPTPDPVDEDGDTTGDLLRKLADSREENRALEAEIEELRRRLDLLSEATQTTDRLEQDLADARERLEELTAELERARTAAASRAEALERLRSERDELTERLAASEEQRQQTSRALAAARQAQDRSEEIQAELDAERQRHENLTAELALARAAAATRAETLESLRREHDQLTQRLSQAESQAESQPDELARQLSQAESQRDELAQKLSQTENQRDELAQRLSAAVRQRDDLAGQLAAERSSTPAAEPAPGELLVPAEPLRWEPPVEPDAPAAEPQSAEVVTPEPPLAGIPPPPAPPIPEVVAATVHDWAAAWQEQRVDDYLDFYAADFAPADGSSRQRWAAVRRTRLAGPRFIEISLEELEVTVLGDDSAVARFQQRYRSDRFADSVVKRLTMVRRDGRWKIAREEVE